MRLVLTGGGTGGHVFPALEVGRLAREAGAEVLYLGSQRGLEGGACRKLGIPFEGFPSEPLYSLKTPRGWLGLAALLRARGRARRALRAARPSVVFSTGGYAAGPVVSAAHSLGLPVVLHEQNAVPGRSNRLFARRSFAVATTFYSAEPHFKGIRILRTGMPVRKDLRDLAATKSAELLPLILVVGGSQGAQSLNESALGAAVRMTGMPVNWLHVTGKAHFEDVFHSYEQLALKHCYDVKSFLEGSAMGDAYSRATLAVCRAGAGTLSELAAFRIPCVAVPYPHAYANHQAHNAGEFVEMGAATLVEQEGLTPTRLEKPVREWLDDAPRRESASAALANWDAPDAAERIYGLIREAANASK